jgi:kynureninase
LIDGYHAFDVVPVETGPTALVLGGGYKYAQFGEGLCWLRLPPGLSLRPIYTGWFADFAGLAHGRSDGPTAYDASGWGFSGATFDGSAAYRADAALDVFDRHGLDVATLRAISLAQTQRILDWYESSRLARRGAALVTPRDPARRAGFVSIRTPGASGLVAALRAKGVYTDSRGDLLRLGPAPYLTDEEIDRGLAAVDEVLTSALS